MFYIKLALYSFKYNHSFKQSISFNTAPYKLKLRISPLTYRASFTTINRTTFVFVYNKFGASALLLGN